MNGLLAMAFVTGLVAPASPCGFALLPSWISTTIGDAPTDRLAARLDSAIRSGLGLTIGFTGTLIAIALIISAGARSLITVAPWLGLAFGLGLLVVAGLIAAGATPHLRLPGITTRGWSGGSSFGRSIAYGIGFASAPLSCTFGVLLAVIGQAQATATSAELLLVFAAYAAGAATVLLLVAGLTAAAGTALAARLARLARHSRAITAALLTPTGAYLAWFWYPVATGESTGISSPLTQLSGTASAWIQSHPVLVITAALVMLGIAAGTVIRRRKTNPAETDRPHTGKTTTMTAQQNFAVTGMHCGGCATSIQTALARVDGVQHVSADADTQRVRVQFDAQMLTAAEVATQLERIGFPVADAGSAT